MLKASSTPLYIKIALLQNFPIQPPIINVMVAVVHPFIDPKSLEYIGPSIINWNPSSNLIATI
jgi:ubiquitin-protein ligase